MEPLRNWLAGLTGDQQFELMAWIALPLFFAVLGWATWVVWRSEKAD